MRKLIDDNVESTKIAQNSGKSFSVSCNKDLDEVSAGRYAEFEIKINGADPKADYTLILSFNFNVQDRDLEWIVNSEGLLDKKIKQEEISTLVLPSKNESVTMKFSGKFNNFKIKVLTPKSSVLGDWAEMTIRVFNEKNPSQDDSCKVKINLISTIVALKTQAGKEVEVARDLGNKIKLNKIDYVFSILVPGITSKMKGYVFVETIQPDRILSFIKNVKGIKGVVKGEMKISEIMHWLTPRAAVETLQVGNFVELIDGPFKGEKGRIIEIDMANDKIVVELSESLVPIPITVKASSVRVLEKE